MPTTTNRAYPYPAASLSADVPYWNQQLAEKVDTDVFKLKALPRMIRTRTGANEAFNGTLANQPYDNQQLALNTTGALTWDATLHRATFSKAGLVRVLGTVTTGNTVNTFFNLELRKNGVTNLVRNNGGASTSSNVTHRLDWILEVAAGDYIEMRRSSGAAVNVIALDGAMPVSTLQIEYLELY